MTKFDFKDSTLVVIGKRHVTKKSDPHYTKQLIHNLTKVWMQKSNFQWQWISADPRSKHNFIIPIVQWKV